MEIANKSEEANLREYLIKTYNCRTCKFIYFEHIDQKEVEKCGLSGKYNTVSTDRKLEELIAKHNLDGIVCQYWQKRDGK
jgi:hypothetical protein